MEDGLLLGRYELHERLGRGGMASVHRAVDTQLGRSVAVKLFPAGTAVDDARRRAEATLLGRLSHPHLVALHDAHLAAEGDTTPTFLVLELVEGSDLRSRLADGPVPPELAATIAADIADALVAVHDAGMVHRDLKPANILVADSAVPGGRPIVKLADFGIAHLVGAERLTTVGTIIGTAAYLSPEQASGAQAGPPADVYALGLVVLEALTGRTEFPGTPVEAVAARVTRDPRIPGGLPEDWRGLLAAMTARDPALRPTALETAIMARELAPQLAGWTPDAAEEPEDTRVMAGVTAGITVIGAAAAADVAPRAFSGAAAAGATAPGGPTGSTGPTAPLARPRRTRRRRTALGLVVGGGIAAVAAAALTVGSLLAPAPAAPVKESVQTPRPTPTVVAPPATVAPAVAPETGTAPDDAQATVDDNSGQGGAGQGSAGQGGAGQGGSNVGGSGAGGGGKGNAGPGADKPAKPAKDAGGKNGNGNGPGSNSGKGKGAKK